MRSLKCALYTHLILNTLLLLAFLLAGRERDSRFGRPPSLTISLAACLRFNFYANPQEESSSMKMQSPWRTRRSISGSSSLL